jgi:peptide chain release factor 1
MTAIPVEKLDKLLQRWEYIQSELSRSTSQASYVQLTREFAYLY